MPSYPIRCCFPYHESLLITRENKLWRLCRSVKVDQKPTLNYLARASLFTSLLMPFFPRSPTNSSRHASQNRAHPSPALRAIQPLSYAAHRVAIEFDQHSAWPQRRARRRGRGRWGRVVVLASSFRVDPEERGSKWWAHRGTGRESWVRWWASEGGRSGCQAFGEM